MPRSCSICRHQSLSDINTRLVRDEPLRSIAKQMGVVHTSLFRHKEKCIPQLFEAERATRRKGLLGELDDLKQEIRSLRSEFAANGTVRVQLIAKSLDAIQTEAKLTGAFQQHHAVEKSE